MKKIYALCLVGALAVLNIHLYAQASTYTQVHQLLQTNCAGSSCHSGVTSTFNVTLGDSAFYNAIVNATPINPAAAAKGDKLIKPGYVTKSFLLRKLSHGINVPLSLTQPQEGNYMPDGGSPLKDFEFELIRQWILHGAPKDSVVVDTALINTYYRVGGINDAYPYQPAPAAGTGFQMYVGKIFVRPGTEEYYYLKHKPDLASNVEIPRLITYMPQSTHHFVIYKFPNPAAATNYREGLRGENETSHADVADGIGTGKGMWEYNLPPGTAYFWNQTTTLDFNLHIKNSNHDSILAAEIYINAYTQPLGTAQSYMLVANFPVFTISIPQDGQEHTFTEIANQPDATKYWKIWQLYSHTHKYGTDYDIFRREADGSMGLQEYEGLYSYEQDYMVGYYRTGVDVTFKYYPDDSLLTIDPRIGFLHRAKFKNTGGPNPVNWGLTSDEEMMVMGFQYIMGDDLPALTSVNDVVKESIKVNVFPNPASGSVSLNYILERPSDVTIELTNVLGETTTVLQHKNRAIGNYLDEIDLDKRFATGVYLLTLRTPNSVNTQRIVIE
jgi:hypothetical protein